LRLDRLNLVLLRVFGLDELQVVLCVAGSCPIGLCSLAFLVMKVEIGLF